jgi:SAM-dependent methyltransferase
MAPTTPRLRRADPAPRNSGQFRRRSRLHPGDCTTWSATGVPRSSIVDYLPCVLAEEATWIAARIAALHLGSEANVIDVGSSSERTRTVYQPYIGYELFSPLAKRAVNVIHVDARADEGVDVVADVTKPKHLPDRLVASGDLVLCANLLEHVTDRATVLSNLHALTRPGGRLIVTVPHRYPYHPDPIDTGFRPSPSELAIEVSSLFTIEETYLIEASPVGLVIPDGPAWLVTLHASWLVLGKLRRAVRSAYRMPTTCLVSGIVARRDAAETG